jgi:hypothetical protein
VAGDQPYRRLLEGDALSAWISMQIDLIRVSEKTTSRQFVNRDNPLLLVALLGAKPK